MAYPVPSFEQIRDRYLQAIVNQWPDAAIGPDSDHFVRASGTAAVVEGVYAHQSWVYRQAFPDLADPDVMEKTANQRRITRKPAAVATGTVRFQGVADAIVPAGQQLFIAQGIYYATTAAGTVGANGTVDIAAACAVAGAQGNQSPNTPVTVNAPPDGLSGTATILSMTGGDDVEKDDSLLARLLLWLGEEPQGGNAADYKRWALEVPGVKRVFVFNCRRGAGTVDIVPMPVTGLPDAQLLAAVHELLDARRPVGMRPTSPLLVRAPTPVPVAVRAIPTLAPGYTIERVASSLTAAIDAVFAALSPGQTLVRAELVAAVMAVPGVTDVTLLAPSANVTCSVSSTALELVTRGTTTFS